MLDKISETSKPYFEKALLNVFPANQKRFLLKKFFDYQMDSGGKRLRSQVAYLAALEKKGTADFETVLEQVTPFALAIELIHNGTLVHDDVQDGDVYRRGRETVWKRFSIPQGINTGDAFFSLANLTVLNSDFSPELKIELLKIMEESLLIVVEGQAREFELRARFLRGDLITKEDYFDMVEGKTAALFSMPWLGGSTFGKGSVLLPAERRVILEFSGKLGRIFQIADDYIDLWGKKGRESIGRDIAEGKISYPIILGLELGGEDFTREIRSVFAKGRSEVSENDIKECILRLEKLKVNHILHQELQTDLAMVMPPGLQQTGNFLLQKIEKSLTP